MSGPERIEVRAPGCPEPLSHYTDAVRVGDLLFISGCPALDADGNLVGGDDVVAQYAQVLENLRLVLEAAGSTPQDVVKVTVFMTDCGERPLINPLRQRFFGDARPASTLVEVRDLPVPGMRVEMEAVAIVRNG